MRYSSQHHDDAWYQRAWSWVFVGLVLLAVITAMVVINSLGTTPGAPKYSPQPQAGMDGRQADLLGNAPSPGPDASAQPSIASPSASESASPQPSSSASSSTSGEAKPPNDDCPGGDYSPSRTDGTCGKPPAAAAAQPDRVAPQPERPAATQPAAPTPDNCPGGDYTPSRYDGSCGTKPVVADNCPGGDYSPSRYDGSCGTPPVVVSQQPSLGASITSCAYNPSAGSQRAAARVDDPNGQGYTLVIYIGEQSQTFPRVSGTHTFYFDRFALDSALPCSARLI